MKHICLGWTSVWGLPADLQRAEIAHLRDVVWCGGGTPLLWNFRDHKSFSYFLFFVVLTSLFNVSEPLFPRL